MPRPKTGVILGIDNPNFSGLAAVVLKTRTGIQRKFLDAGFGVRQLVGATGNKPRGAIIQYFTASYSNQLIEGFNVIGRVQVERGPSGATRIKKGNNPFQRTRKKRKR